MKKVMFVLLAGLMPLVACQQKKVFTLKGQLTGETESPLLLGKYGAEGFETIDTLQLKEGVLSYNAELTYPELLVIKTDGSREQAMLFAENEVFTITGDVNKLSEAEVTSVAPLFADYKKFSDRMKEMRAKGEELRMEFAAANEAGDTARQAEIRAEFDAMGTSFEDDQMAYVKENSASALAAFYVNENFRYRPLEEIEEGLAMLDSTLVNHPYRIALVSKAEKLRTVAVGKMAPDFTMNDVNGNPLSLSSFKGKYVLVDFWASWCGPCRRENPNVVKLYNEFKDKGFDILGVSLDQKEAAWLNAIEEDKLAWQQVSDLKGWQNEVAQLYVVSSIPHTVLIDKDGVIIAKNLRGDELHETIKGLLN